MNATWKAVIGVILVFILGWFGGALTTLVIARHVAQNVSQHEPQALASYLERVATHGIALDADKRRQIHELLTANVQQRLMLQRQIQPQVHTINRDTLQQIDALLNTDEQAHFLKNLMAFRARFGRNPLNTGDDGFGSVPPMSPAEIGASTNAPAR